MRILYIHKDLIFRCPPDISTLLMLKDLGHDVSLITCGINETMQHEFAQRHIAVHVLNNCVDAPSRVAKILQYRRFAKNVKRLLQQYPHDTLLWLEGGSAIWSLGSMLRGRRYVLQIQELWETTPRFFKAIGKVIHQAEAVFMPEFARTSLYQVWFHLKQRPTVLPNKPYFLPTTEALAALRKNYPEYVRLFAEKKVLLYQGHINYDRDLTAYVEAIRRLGPDYRLVLMGKDYGAVQHYKEIDPNIVHIDFIPAPDYLLMTSMAYIGILGYSPISENNIFCAPNKIYEYTAYGLPVLGNDIPGLYYIINQYHAGEIANEKNADALFEALQKLIAHYDDYSQGARRLFAAADNKETLRRALENIEKKVAR